MTIRELIDRLQDIENDFGPNIPVKFVYDGPDTYTYLDVITIFRLSNESVILSNNE